MNQIPLRILKETAKDALIRGGDIVRRGFYRSRRVTYKGPLSPVTQIDLQSERAVIGLIRKRFPGHEFLAEESAFLKKINPHGTASKTYRWLIDPLDGTTNFVHRVPHACVSVAVEHEGEILAGGVIDPFRDELFLAEQGGGAFLNGKRIFVSQEKNLLHSLFITGFPYNHNLYAQKYAKTLVPFLRKTADLRRFGAAAIDLAWIACGRAEGYFEYHLNPWDVGAGYLLVKEAGGEMTDFRGRPFQVLSPVQTLATNREIHKKALNMLRFCLS